MAELVPGRECGSCNACCVVPVIDSPELTKKSGSVCRHSGDAGCEIYENRPNLCRRFFCGWRRTTQIPESWRPDLSGVFVTMEIAGLNLMLVGNPLKTVRQPWFVDFVAGAVTGGITLFLALPGQEEGMQAAMLLLNGVEMDTAARQARGAVKLVLERALKRLSAHDFVPHTMAHDGADVSS